MGFLEGRLESLMEEEREETTESLSLLEVGMSGASGDGPDDQDGDEDNVAGGASLRESMRRESPMPREEGLITQMEREAMEAGLGGWFNGNLEDIPESWSSANSDTSASQDQVGTTLLTTIGGQTLPNPVRVPDNIVHPAVLTSLMEGPVQPWQCLVWSKHWGQGGLETNKNILSTLQAVVESTCHLPTDNRLGTFQMFLQVPGQTHDVGTFMEHFECNINMCNTFDPP